LSYFGAFCEPLAVRASLTIGRAGGRIGVETGVKPRQMVLEDTPAKSGDGEEEEIVPCLQHVRAFIVLRYCAFISWTWWYYLRRWT
jgi:hypothetical protein